MTDFQASNATGGKSIANYDQRKAAGTHWTPWARPSAPEVEDEKPWARRVRLQTLRLLLALGAAALLFIAIRAIALNGEPSWPDIANAVFFGLLLVLSFAWPRWVTAIAWLGLVSLFINAVDGLDFQSEQAVGPVHLLLPLLILYAAFLGNLYMSLVAMLGVLGIYVATWATHGDMPPRETLMLTNLIVLTVFSGAAALGVWLRHSRLERRLDLQADALRTELETRLRLQAMVTHDISTPLTALVNASLLEDPKIVQEMADRIARTIDSARELTGGSGITVSVVSIADIWKYTEEMFSAKLPEKGQRLETSGDTTVLVEADLAILCNSVLGNFVTNAIKFSPRGSTIRMTSDPLGDNVRIAVFDEGPGLPDEMLQRGPETSRSLTRKGTEGEQGTGYGLQIAALCAARMGGRVELGTGSGGGSVSVLLPRANLSEKSSAPL